MKADFEFWIHLLNMKIIYWLFMIIVAIPAHATTYSEHTIEELIYRSDATVIGTVISTDIIKNKNAEICRYIAQYKILYSFKEGIKKGDVITANYFEDTKLGDNVLLFLTDYNNPTYLFDGTYIPQDTFDFLDRCKTTKKPDYLIMMSGIGLQNITQANSSELIKGIIEFRSHWIILPKILELEVVGEDWDEITRVRVSDFISYYRNGVPYVFENDGHIYISKNSGDAVQLTTEGDSYAPLLSPDRKFIVYSKTSQKRIYAGSAGESGEPGFADELWIMNIDGSKNSKIIEPRGGEPTETIVAFKNMVFSPDGRYLYFVTPAWVTSAAVHMYDFQRERTSFISSGQNVDVVGSGINKGLIYINGKTTTKKEGGRIWFNALYDNHGNLFEIKHNCFPYNDYAHEEVKISDILDKNNHPKFIQNYDDYVCVQK